MSSFLRSTSWPGTLHFILHTFLHPVIIFFCNTCPYHRNLFHCSSEIMSCHLNLNSPVLCCLRQFCAIIYANVNSSEMFVLVYSCSFLVCVLVLYSVGFFLEGVAFNAIVMLCFSAFVLFCCVSSVSVETL